MPDDTKKDDKKETKKGPLEKIATNFAIAVGIVLIVMVGLMIIEALIPNIFSPISGILRSITLGFGSIAINTQTMDMNVGIAMQRILAVIIKFLAIVLGLVVTFAIFGWCIKKIKEAF